MNNLENSNNYDVNELNRSIADDDNLKQFLEEYKIAKISEINFKKYFKKMIIVTLQLLMFKKKFLIIVQKL